MSSRISDKGVTQQSVAVVWAETAAAGIVKANSEEKAFSRSSGVDTSRGIKFKTKLTQKMPRKSHWVSISKGQDWSQNSSLVKIRDQLEQNGMEASQEWSKKDTGKLLRKSLNKVSPPGSQLWHLVITWPWQVPSSPSVSVSYLKSDRTVYLIWTIPSSLSHSVNLFY